MLVLEPIYYHDFDETKTTGWMRLERIDYCENGKESLYGGHHTSLIPNQILKKFRKKQ